MKKKILLVLLTIAFVGVAGAAVAKGRFPCGRYPGNRHDHNVRGWQGAWENARNAPQRPAGMEYGRKFSYGPACPAMKHWEKGPNAHKRWKPASHDRMENRWENAPEEIRTKMVDLAKLKIDMRDAISRNPVDRTKATELFGKMAVLRQDIAAWRFSRKLDQIEARQKQLELNRKIPPQAPNASADSLSAPKL